MFTTFFDNIRDVVRISDVMRPAINLTRRGENYIGLCPFHAEKTPSFSVNDRKGFYYCFGCNASGDVIKFVSEFHHLSYRDAAISLAEKYGVAIPKLSHMDEKEEEQLSRFHTIIQLATNFYQQNLLKIFANSALSYNKSIYDYMLSRNVSHDLIRKYSLGYADGYSNNSILKFLESKGFSLNELVMVGLMGQNESSKELYDFFRKRLMIPIFDAYSKPIAFGGRSIGDLMPKYLNSPETVLFKKSETLFGENIAASSAYKSNKIILVEGYFDVMALQNNGFENSVAALGTAVTLTHVKKLWKYADEIIVCLDGDSAGIKAAKRLLDIALPHVNAYKNISFITMRGDKDPDALLYSDNGKLLFNKMFDERENISSYIWNIISRDKEPKTAEEYAKIEFEYTAYLNMISDNILKRNISHFFKNQLWYLNRHSSAYEVNTKKLQKQKVVDFDKDKFTNAVVKSEIEILEEMIVLFYILNAQQLYANGNFDIHFELSAIRDNNSFLAPLIDYVLLYDGEKINFIEAIKNNSIASIFSLLCHSYSFSDICSHDLDYAEFLNFLFAKRYLIKLKNEYTGVLLDDSIKQEKIDFYMKEIRIVQSKIDNFSQKYFLK